MTRKAVKNLKGTENYLDLTRESLNTWTLFEISTSAVLEAWIMCLTFDMGHLCLKVSKELRKTFSENLRKFTSFK